jgi:hypothetical protein
MSKVCSKCNINKNIIEFYKNRVQCKVCINNKRREKYKNNNQYREKCIKLATEFKIEKQNAKYEKYIKEIGIGNKKCKYCHIIKEISKFRHNRLKCKDCERDNLKEKFKRYVRTRIYNCLKRNKNKRSVDYLGCSNEEYFNYIMTYNKDYTIENYGKIWHIDHVIPISTFDMSNNNDTKIAFNWRNTMPLYYKDNLRKNNKIDTRQIRTHLEYLNEYHKNNNIKLPKEFNDLLAKHLDAGNPLEPQTTTPILETELEELG